MRKNLQEEFQLWLPLPVDLSMAIKSLEIRFTGGIDKFVRMSELEDMDDLKYKILGGGVERNMYELQLDEKIWDNCKSMVHFIASGGSGVTYNIMADYRINISLTATRLVTGFSFLDILYKGQLYILDKFDKDGDYDLYESICDRIQEMIIQNPKLDLERLTLKNIHPKKAS